MCAYEDNPSSLYSGRLCLEETRSSRSYSVTLLLLFSSSSWSKNKVPGRDFCRPLLLYLLAADLNAHVVQFSSFRSGINPEILHSLYQIPMAGFLSLSSFLVRINCSDIGKFDVCTYNTI